MNINADKIAHEVAQTFEQVNGAPIPWSVLCPCIVAGINKATQPLLERVKELEHEKRLAGFTSANLQSQLTTLEAVCAEKNEAWFTAMVRAYTIAYKHGHEDTVEARYVDVVQAEETTYFNDAVIELVNDNAVMPELADAMQPTSGQRILEENRRMREALKRLWDDDEMGWIIDGSTFECNNCGCKSNTKETIKHDEGCVQGYIFDAINL